MPAFWATAVCRGTGAATRTRMTGWSDSSRTASRQEVSGDHQGETDSEEWFSGNGHRGDGGRGAEYYDIGSSGGQDTWSTWSSYHGENWSWTGRSDRDNWEWVDEPDRWTSLHEDPWAAAAAERHTAWRSWDSEESGGTGRRPEDYGAWSLRGGRWERSGGREGDDRRGVEGHEGVPPRRPASGNRAEPFSPTSGGGGARDVSGELPSGEVSSPGDKKETPVAGDRRGKVSSSYPPVFKAKPGESFKEWRRAVDFWLGGEAHQIPPELIGPRLMVQLRDRAGQLVHHLTNEDVNGVNGMEVIMKALEKSPIIRQLDRHKVDQHRKKLMQLRRYLVSRSSPTSRGARSTARSCRPSTRRWRWGSASTRGTC